MKNRMVMIGLVLLAVGVRLCFLPSAKIIESDGVLYTRHAQSLLKGEGFVNLAGKTSIITRPLYPILLGLADKIVNDQELSGRIVSIIFGSLIPVLIYVITRQVFGAKEALLAGILVSLSPVMASAATQVLTETLYTFVVLLGILSLCHALTKGRTFMFFIAGLIWGLPYLTRPEGIGYLAICIVIILFMTYPATSLKRRALFLICFILGALISVSPLIICLRSYTGVWTLTQEVSRFQPTGLGTYLRNLYYCAYLQDIPRLFPPLLIALSAIGFFRSLFPDRKIWHGIYLASFAIYPLLVYPATPACAPRHYVMILPLLYVWVAKTAMEPWSCLSPHKHKKNLGILLTTLLIFVVVLNFLPRLLAPLKRADPFLKDPLEYRISSKWMKDNLETDSLIVSRIVQIAFYSECRLVGIPDKVTNYEEFIEWARREGAGYIVVDRRWTAKLYPWLAFLLDGSNQTQDLELVYEWDERPEYRVMVYKLKESEE